MANCILEAREGAVVEERRLHGDVSEWRCPELVAVVRMAGDLLQAEVLVFVWAVEDHVPGAEPEARRNLWNADDVHLEIAEHLVGLPGHGVAVHASCSA